MSEFYSPGGGSVALPYNESEERSKLQKQAWQFTEDGPRPTPGVGILVDDPSIYPCQDLKLAKWDYREQLEYIDNDGNKQTINVDTDWMHNRAGLIVPNAHLESMATTFLDQEGLVEEIVEDIQNGEHIGILSGHDFFLDIEFTLFALRRAAKIAHKNDEEIARLIGSQSASVVNKHTAWQNLLLPANEPKNDPDKTWVESVKNDPEIIWERFVSADVLSLIGTVFFAIAPTKSTVDAGINPTLQKKSGGNMGREIIPWRRESEENGLGTILMAAPPSSVNKRDTSNPEAKQVEVTVPPAVLGIASLVKRCAKVIEIASVYDHRTGGLDIGIVSVYKPDRRTIDMDKSMERITKGSNELSESKGYPMRYYYNSAA